MDLWGAIFTNLGFGIAKGAVKAWLKEDAEEISLAAATTGVEVAEALFKGKREDYKAKNAIIRLVSQIQDKVSDELLAEIEQSYPKLSAEEKTLAAKNAGTVIGATEISAELLAKQSLDAAELTIFFLSRGGAEGGHPRLAKGEDPQSQLYQELVRQGAQWIVEIAEVLPGYSRQSFAEVLRREREIVGLLNQLLDDVARIQSQSLGSTESLQEFEKLFRRYCNRVFDSLQLFGVDADASTKKYNLSTAYVALSLTEGLPNSGPEDSSDPLSVLDAITTYKRLIVRGKAGAGKSTLMQWLIVNCSAMRFEEGCFLNKRVAFLLRLRNYVDKPLPPVFELAAITAPPYAGEKATYWAEQILKEKRAVVLIDGLDEFPEDRLDELEEWVSSLLELDPENHLVCLITTRPHAAPKGWLKGVGFFDTLIDDMSNEQVDEFVDHWHEAVAKNELSQEEVDEILAAADNLKTEIRLRPTLQQLAGTPMLCALICLLHARRRGEIPENVKELYGACFQLFFRRDDSRNVRGLPYPKLSETHMTFLLTRLSLRLLRSGKSELSAAECDKCFEKLIPSIQPPVETTGSRIRQLFVQRVAILQEVADGVIGFPHRSFFEFLAAQEIDEDIALSELLNNLDRPGWREVAALAGYVLSEKKASELALQLVGRSQKDPSLVCVAAAIVNAMPSIDPNSRASRKVGQALKQVIPPARIADVSDLIVAKDLAAKHIQPISNYTVRQATACIRLLARIGNERCFTLLRDASKDFRVGVQTALIQSYEWSTDPKRYAEYVLHRVIGVILQPYRRGVYVDGFGELSVELLYRLISSLKNLRVLSADKQYLPRLQTERVFGMPSLRHVLLYDYAPRTSEEEIQTSAQAHILKYPANQNELDTMFIKYCDDEADYERPKIVEI